jgi:hypothetical protein
LEECAKNYIWVILNSLYNKIMGRWVKAGVIENRFEGDRISQALNQAGIPFLIKSFLDTAYNGLYLPQKGWGAILVPEEFGEEAERVILEVRISFGKGERDETE